VSAFTLGSVAFGMLIGVEPSSELAGIVLEAAAALGRVIVSGG
jgi:hypothetical protein